MSDSNEDKKQRDLEASPDRGVSNPNQPAKKPNLYERICHNKAFQTACRVGQCLSSLIGLILFAIRLRRLAQHAVDAVTASNGAVMGIFAAAFVYGLVGLFIRSALKNGGPMYLRFVWIVFDILFIVAFIMAAELTAPGRNMTSGPCHTTTKYVSIQGTLVDIYNELNCNLPLGTFIMAIFNVYVYPLISSLHLPIGEQSTVVADRSMILQKLTSYYQQNPPHTHCGLQPRKRCIQLLQEQENTRNGSDHAVRNTNVPGYQARSKMKK